MMATVPPDRGRPITEASKIKYGHGFLAGGLASLALPPFDAAVLILCLAVPFLYASVARTKKEALLLGWSTGLGWFLFSLWWIGHAFVISGGAHILLIPFAVLGLPLLLGGFWGVSFLLAQTLSADPLQRLMVLGITLGASEYGRGFVMTGFPWNAPGMIFAGHDGLIGAASVLGYWGLSLVAVLLPLMVALLVLNGRRHALVILTVVMVLPLASWFHANQSDERASTSGLTVRIVQPSIAQADKWDRSKRPDHLVTLMDMSRQPTNPKPDLLVWPETAFAGFISDEQSVFSAVTGAATGDVSHLLTGSLRLEENTDISFFNTAVLVSPDGHIAASYDKSHLVPFGEYAPLRGIIPFVDAIAGPADFTPGKGFQPMAVVRDDGQAVRILPLICYEVIFPSAVRGGVLAQDADLIVTITNDGWFGDTIGPRQHLAMARLRSVELGLPLLRAANTGISAVIDAKGQVLSHLDYGRTGVIDGRLAGKVSTVYRQYGDLCFTIMLLVIAMACKGLTLSYFRR